MKRRVSQDFGKGIVICQVRWHLPGNARRLHRRASKRRQVNPAWSWRRGVKPHSWGAFVEPGELCPGGTAPLWLPPTLRFRGENLGNPALPR